MKKLYILLFVLFILSSCSSPKDSNYLRLVEFLPSGDYIIYNYGSRHIVKCELPNGKYYYLNDNDFAKNGIIGYDAHQYREKTKITIK